MRINSSCRAFLVLCLVHNKAYKRQSGGLHLELDHKNNSTGEYHGRQIGYQKHWNDPVWKNGRTHF